MVDWSIALYYGIGVAISQLLHTGYTHRNVPQKKVPIFEHITIVGGLGRRYNLPLLRRLPDISRYVDPSSIEAIAPQSGLSSHPFLKPWKMRYFQRPSPPYSTSWKYMTARLNRMLGLQATNLVYCYLAALIFGGLSVIILRFFLPSPESFTPRTVARIFMTLGALIILSWELVGSSFAQLSIESTLALNTVVLITIQVGGVAIASSLLGLGATIAIAGLINWMSEVREEDEFDRGNLIAGYYAVGSFIYAESIVLALLLINIG